MNEIESVANNMAIAIIAEDDQKKKRELLLDLIELTTPLWDGVICAEYCHAVWGQLFLTEMRFNEEGQSLPLESHESGDVVLLKGLPLFKFIKTNTYHPDRTPVIDLAVTPELLDRFLADFAKKG
jgi:hypothetical protein